MNNLIRNIYNLPKDVVISYKFIFIAELYRSKIFKININKKAFRSN